VRRPRPTGPPRRLARGETCKILEPGLHATLIEAQPGARRDGEAGAHVYRPWLGRPIGERTLRLVDPPLDPEHVGEQTVHTQHTADGGAGSGECEARAELPSAITERPQTCREPAADRLQCGRSPSR